MPMMGAAIAVAAWAAKTAFNEVAKEGVFLSWGFGKDPETKKLETHLHVTTWEGRFDAGHTPETQNVSPSPLKVFVYPDEDILYVENEEKGHK